MRLDPQNRHGVNYAVSGAKRGGAPDAADILVNLPGVAQDVLWQGQPTLPQGLARYCRAVVKRAEFAVWTISPPVRDGLLI